MTEFEIGYLMGLIIVKGLSQETVKSIASASTCMRATFNP